MSRDAADVRAGLEQRYGLLLAENKYALARLASGYTNSTSDREDLLQDIAMAIWQALPAFRGECSDLTFIFRIAHNRAITWLSRSRARGISSDEDNDVRDASPTPEAALLRQEQGDRLTSAVRALPVAYRQAVMLTLEGLSYGEISMVLGISESNVGARLTRAKQMLRQIMEGLK